MPGRRLLRSRITIQSLRGEIVPLYRETSVFVISIY